MGADLSLPVVPSESRLRSYDVSDVIVIIGIIVCHVAWSPSHFKSPERAAARSPCGLYHRRAAFANERFREPRVTSSQSRDGTISETFYILW